MTLGALGRPAAGVLWALAVAALLLHVPASEASDEGDAAAAQALIREGTGYLEAGNIERAARQFERAVQLAPSNPSVYVHLARARGAAKRYAEAHKVLARADIHAQGDKKALYEILLVRGDLHRDEGKIDLARAAYQRAAGTRLFHREATARLQALDAPLLPPAED